MLRIIELESNVVPNVIMLFIILVYQRDLVSFALVSMIVSIVASLVLTTFVIVTFALAPSFAFVMLSTTTII